MNTVVRRNVVFVGENLEFQLLSNGGDRNSNSATRMIWEPCFPHVVAIDIKLPTGMCSTHRTKPKYVEVMLQTHKNIAYQLKLWAKEVDI